METTNKTNEEPEIQQVAGIIDFNTYVKMLAHCKIHKLKIKIFVGEAVKEKLARDNS